MEDVTSLFKDTKSHVLQEVIGKGGVVLGTKAEGKNGLLLQDKELSNKLQQKISKESGVQGFISTDELPKYGINKADKQTILERFNCGPNDVVVLVADQAEPAKKAIGIIEKELTQ